MKKGNDAIRAITLHVREKTTYNHLAKGHENILKGSWAPFVEILLIYPINLFSVAQKKCLWTEAQY